MATLGASPDLVVRRLRAAGVAEHPGDKPPRAIDLGCGPGGVSVALARRMRIDVVGVDGCPAFIKAANERAKSAGIDTRCTFVVSALESFIRSRTIHRDYDVALMLNVWPALRAARATRGFVRTGGVYVIDDAVRDRMCTDRAWRAVPTLDDVSERIRVLGDEVLHARVIAPPAMAKVETTLQRQLTTNARRLARKHPHLARSLREFVRSQREAAGVLDGPLRGAMWVVRKT